MLVRVKFRLELKTLEQLYQNECNFFSVVAVRSQGPPTRTKKGSRPARRGDNVDRGLPSGADVPDGRRFGTRPAPRPAGRAAVPPRRRVAPPRQPGRTQTRAGRRPPPAARRPVQHPAPLQRQPPPSLYQQLFGQASCDAFCDRAGYKPVCTIYGNTYDNDCYRECRWVYILCSHTTFEKTHISLTAQRV